MLQSNRSGHIQRNCSFKEQQNEGVNMAEIGDTEHEGIALISNSVNQSSEWFIDSAATKHIINDINDLDNYVEYKEPIKIYLGGDTMILAFGEGNAQPMLSPWSCTKFFTSLN